MASPGYQSNLSRPPPLPPLSIHQYIGRKFQTLLGFKGYRISNQFLLFFFLGGGK